LFAEDKCSNYGEIIPIPNWEGRVKNPSKSKQDFSDSNKFADLPGTPCVEVPEAIYHVGQERAKEINSGQFPWCCSIVIIKARFL
jgi:hypothetical protein